MNTAIFTQARKRAKKLKVKNVLVAGYPLDKEGILLVDMNKVLNKTDSGDSQ